MDTDSFSRVSVTLLFAHSALERNEATLLSDQVRQNRDLETVVLSLEMKQGFDKDRTLSDENEGEDEDC